MPPIPLPTPRTCTFTRSPRFETAYMSFSLFFGNRSPTPPHLTFNTSPSLRCHGLLCGRFHKLWNRVVVRDGVVAPGWSARDLTNDLGRRDRLFFGHIHYAFVGIGPGVGSEGELEHLRGDLDNL